MAACGTKVAVAHPVLYVAAGMVENNTSIVTTSMAASTKVAMEIHPPLNSYACTLRILVIGATGYIGRFVAQAAVAAGHPTYALIRPSTASDPAKSQLVQELKDSGVYILYVYVNLILRYKSFVISLLRVLRSLFIHRVLHLKYDIIHENECRDI